MIRDHDFNFMRRHINFRPIPSFCEAKGKLFRSTATGWLSRNASRVAALLMSLCVVPPSQVQGAGVTVITHGFKGNVDDWIIPMAQKMTEYYRFPGTTSTCYEIYFLDDGQGGYLPAQRRIGGVVPASSQSGEIIVKMDWSQLAGGFFEGAPFSTKDVTPVFAAALMSTNFIPEMGGRSLAEMPLHLIGHSRGGSMVCEITRILGAEGIWVDHLTTLDPHPLNNDGNDDTFVTPTVDGPALVYQNVLFADNYYQQNNSVLGYDPSGEPLLGAYNRYLGNLSGGNILSHSDVHLWYHGTIDLGTPATDTQATITATERQSWWTAQENGGVYTGFYWSLLGRGDRLSLAEPAGLGTGRVRDGYNKLWDLGAGLDSNRYALPTNNGSWPNLIRLNLVTTNNLSVGETNRLTYFYQYAAASEPTCQIEWFLDNDLNPFNGDLGIIAQRVRSSTGIAGMGTGSVDWVPDPNVIAPGTYAIYAKISANNRRRYLYAQEILQLKPSLLPPSLELKNKSASQATVTVHGYMGQRIVVQASADLLDWVSLGTNVVQGDLLELVDTGVANHLNRFYRAALDDP